MDHLFKKKIYPVRDVKDTGLKSRISNGVYLSIALALFLIIIGIQLIDLNAEYHSMGWTIQHDEKLILPDARAFYLKGDQKLKDYTEPISADFGFLGPRIVQLGFGLFGLNNYGLRLLFVISSGIATLFFLFSLLYINTNKIGFSLALLHLLNYKYFILARYALLENILILFFCGIIWFYLIKRDSFLKNIYRIAFLCGSLFLIKQNFPFYCYILLVCFALAERFPLRKFLKLLLWSIMGLSIFVFLQMIVLHKMGLSEIYISNILRTCSVFTGLTRKYFSTQTYPGPPGIIAIIPRYFELFKSWYVQGYVDTSFVFGFDKIATVNKIAGFLLFFSILSGAIWLFSEKKLSKISFSLGLFLILILILSSQMFFYIKRAVPFFFVAYLFIASFYSDVIRTISGKRIKVFINHIVFVAILFLLLIQTCAQAKHLKDVYPPLKTYGVERNSRDLDNLLPQKATIYAHCYGFRFFWQSHHRIISGDDQLINNQAVLDKAIREGGRYVLLDNFGGPCVVKEGYQLKQLKSYFSDDSDSGYRINYGLFEIIHSK